MRLFETALSEIGIRDRNAWRSLAAPDGVLTSPYLLPEFADLVEAQRGDVRVVIAEEAARLPRRSPLNPHVIHNEHHRACCRIVTRVTGPQGSPHSASSASSSRRAFRSVWACSY